MRARAAYISSLGTTTILVGASLLMLTVVSAIVGFRGWPGMVSGSGVEAVPLSPASPPARSASFVRTSPVHKAARVTRATAATRRRASTAGLVKVPSGRAPNVPGLGMAPVPVSPMASSPVPRTIAPVPPTRPPHPVSDNRDNTPDLPPAPNPGQFPISAPDAGGSDQVTGLAGMLLSSAPPPAAR
jgi:hypothetical protein